MSPDVTITDKFVFFWRGWPSQWIRSTFTLDGITYNCCEQYMMAEKARVFGDTQTLNRILETTSPKQQQAHGREVRGFKEQTWNSVCRGIVYSGNLAKFQQNRDLSQLLLETGERMLVEASPVDRIWGVGLAVDHGDVNHPDRWPGTNWLGIALMQVRDTLCDPAKPLAPVLQQQFAARFALKNLPTTLESAT